MLLMIIKMSGITLLYIMLTILLWLWTKERELKVHHKLIIGIIFGISSVMSTHFGVKYSDMVINVRDIGPLAAGLFFSPSAGVIAGLIGGIERYIVGTYFGIGSYTRIACSVSTCLAGFVALGMRIKVFNGRKPAPIYAFFMGAVMEVFHMYVVFITHHEDMRMAFVVVSTCAIPMIIFTGIGMAVSSTALQIFTHEWVNPFEKTIDERVPISQKFQRYLFAVTSIVIAGNLLFSYILQTQSAEQNSKATISENVTTIRKNYLLDRFNLEEDHTVIYAIINNDRVVVRGLNEGEKVSENEYKAFMSQKERFRDDIIFGEKALIFVNEISADEILVCGMKDSEVYWYRDAQAYENALGDILLFTVIYVLIAFLVNQIVVNNIRLINKSLSKITNGNLNEVVTVRNSSEFASLSDDINQTVVTLKGYIEAAEKRIEQELILARTIQESALPNNFEFPDRDDFNLFASMKAAKVVGGDFYDFFFVGMNKIALVIADVSGKGIPAALFMMRSKTAIRSFAEMGGSPEEIFVKANKELCEGNDAEMFVTAWIGILDLTTGKMRCANAGHEYPAICHKGGEYELLMDKHTLALAAMPMTKPKEYEIQLEPGDRLFVYTDGVAEALNEKIEQYGTERMIETLNTTREMSISDTLSVMSESLTNFKGDAEQFDDITMLGFEFIKKASGK